MVQRQLGQSRQQPSQGRELHSDLHVLHLGSSIGPRSTGLGVVGCASLAAQRHLGVQADLWTVDSQSDYQWAIREHNLDSSWVRNFKRTGPRCLAFSSSLVKDLLMYREHHFDVIHQQGLWLATSIGSVLWHRKHHSPVVIAPQGFLDPWALGVSQTKKRIASMLYETANLREATCLQAASEMEYFNIRAYGLTNPVAIIPNGINETQINVRGSAPRFFAKHNIDPRKRVALFISRIHPKKGLPMLIQAMANQGMFRQDWVLAIAGFSEMGHREELEALAVKLGVADSIHFIGSVYGTDKQDAFAAAEVSVLPTYADAFALFVLDSIAAGVPVLTTQAAPWSSLTKHGCGWWVEPCVEGLETALMQISRCSRLDLQVMGLRGMELARKYTWQRIAPMQIEMYRWMLGKADRPDFVRM